MDDENEGDEPEPTLETMTIASLAGPAGTLDRPLSWAEMREIAREERLAEKYPEFRTGCSRS
jgi:hypothetical protein